MICAGKLPTLFFTLPPSSTDRTDLLAILEQAELNPSFEPYSFFILIKKKQHTFYCNKNHKIEHIQFNPI